MAPKITLLAGGTGGARLAVGFQAVLPPGHLSVITNIADDIEMWGLKICPDTDAVLFRLGGIFDEQKGYGLAEESFTLLDQMGRLGEETWFRLGDRDLAFHVLRTERLHAGARLTEAIAELVDRLKITARVLPVTDDVVATYFETAAGRLGFQEYFVRERMGPALKGIVFAGLKKAKPSPEALAAVKEADLVIIGPSNPLISIAPITTLLRSTLDPARTVAISPLVGGIALKGPTVEMLRSLCGEATPEQVAREYKGLAEWFVLDQVDWARADAVNEAGCRPLRLDTVMRDESGAQRLAEAILEQFQLSVGR
ncbi:MAG: 2-phospho-L-lactate transferase [Candidatus Dormibacteraceae bacterium]